MTQQDYELEREQLKAVEDARRGVTPLCPAHHHPMQLIYGAGWDYDRWVCGDRGCHHEIELEISSLPKGSG